MKLHKYDGKCEDQQQYEYIIETATVSTPEGFTDNSPMSPGRYMTVKK